MDFYVVCNWKTYISSNIDAIEVAREIKESENIKVIICPSSIHIAEIAKELKNSNVYVGAQDISVYDGGSNTGRISAKQINNIDVKYVIVGHAETRARGITNIDVADKVIHSLRYNIRPIVCISEEEQLKDILEYIKKKTLENSNNESKKDMDFLALFKNALIAYEPLAYIGALEAFSPKEMSSISNSLKDIFSEYNISSVPVLYGGSVTAGNIREVVSVGKVDGVLVGRASVTAVSVNSIIKNISI